MYIFAQKAKATHQTTSAKSTEFSRKFSGQIREASSILDLQRLIGNQAVQQLLKAKSEKQNAVSAMAESPRFGDDFTGASVNDLHLIAQNGLTGTADRLPHLGQIQRSFGRQHDLSGVKAYVGGQAAKAAEPMGAEAYTGGGCIALR